MLLKRLLKFLQTLPLIFRDSRIIFLAEKLSMGKHDSSDWTGSPSKGWVVGFKLLILTCLEMFLKELLLGEPRYNSSHSLEVLQNNLYMKDLHMFGWESSCTLQTLIGF